MSRHDHRRQPSRNNTGSSWITIDWGKPQPPSKLHGVLDQIAGQILRDRNLINQGKTEWKRAIALRRKKAARGRGSGGSTPLRSSNTLKNRDPARRGGRIAAGAKKTSSGGIGGFFGSLFGKKSAAASSAAVARKQSVRRAMTKPGEQRDRHRSSGGARRPSGGAERKHSTRR